MALTKRIDELGAYGSVDESKKGADILEISKNSGTTGSPIYAIGDSKQIKISELADLIGGIPYSGSNYEVVKNNGTDEENGTKLIAALIKCYTKTPNGNALSNTNRSVVYLLAGVYNVQAVSLAVGQFVDIIGIGDSKSILITGSTANEVIKIANTNNYTLLNFSIENSGAGRSIGHNSGQTDNGNWLDIKILNGKTTENTIFAGYYYKVESLSSIILNGDISGIVDSCTFGTQCCGYSETGAIIVSGTIKNCIGSGYCFGVSLIGAVNITGEIDNCKSDYNSFGYNEATGYDITISGKIKNCEATSNKNFGSSDHPSSKIYITGEIENCKSNGLSFGFSTTSSNVEVSGKIKNCKDYGLNSFGRTMPTGLLYKCEGGSITGIHRGTILRCDFENPASSFKPTIEITDGASVKFSSIIQLEVTRDSIKIVEDAEVSISHTESNQEFNFVSGDDYVNLVPIPNNVIWTETGIKIPSPDGSIWRLTIDNSGIPTTELL